MSVKLITYDLNNENSSTADYEKIYKYIRSQDSVRLSESSYAVDNTSTPQEIFDYLLPAIDSDDHLLVITLRTPYWGRHNAEVMAWLKAHLQ